MNKRRGDVARVFALVVTLVVVIFIIVAASSGSMDAALVSLLMLSALSFVAIFLAPAISLPSSISRRLPSARSPPRIA